MKSVFTRTATIKDLQELVRLFDAYRQFYGQVSDPSLAQTFLRDRMEKGESVILVADVAGRMAGFCQMYPTFCSVSAAPVYVLYDLYVMPEERNSGVGRTLLLAAEKLAAQGGFVRIDLSTAKTNHIARALYESLGWKRDDVFFVYNKFVEIPTPGNGII